MFATKVISYSQLAFTLTVQQFSCVWLNAKAALSSHDSVSVTTTPICALFRHQPRYQYLVAPAFIAQNSEEDISNSTYSSQEVSRLKSPSLTSVMSVAAVSLKSAIWHDV